MREISYVFRFLIWLQGFLFDRRFSETAADDRIVVVFNISDATQAIAIKINILMAFDRVPCYHVVLLYKPSLKISGCIFSIVIYKKYYVNLLC